MPEHVQHPDLQLNEEFVFQQSYWVFQRFTWILLLLLVLAALLGLFGTGPLSRAVATTPDGHIEIEHDRFARQQTPQTLRFRAADLVTQPTLWLSREFLEAGSLETIVPEPKETQLDSRGMTLRFDSAEPMLSGSIIATIDYRPHCCGAIRASIGSSPESSVSIWQFVYP